MTSGSLPRVRSRAQSIVEFALVIPIFLGVMLALFDAARFFAVYIGLTNGVISGARVASFPATSTTAIQNAVVQSIIMADTTAIRGTVTVTPSTRVAGNPVTVSASTTFTWDPVIGAVLSTTALGTVTITRSATATVEGP